jgi:16S rRNA (adenine1518-N6/adenine1519-N6)-dimethyltransferase
VIVHNDRVNADQHPPMEAQTLGFIQRTLAELEAHPAKALGQNFLHDRNLARHIVSLLDIRPGDHVVEIGPGLGALTCHIASSPASRITLLEKDDRLVPRLRSEFASDRIRLVHGDALDFDLRELWGGGPVKIIGNLPYYISTPLLATFTSALSPASILVFTLQLELAQRLGAMPRTPEYGAMTVSISRRWRVAIDRKLPASVFHPRPSIDSAVAVFRRKPVEFVRPLDDRRFEAVVRRGFSERRKQLRNLLPELRHDWSDVVAAARITSTARAEELSLAQWEVLATFGRRQNAQRPDEIFDIVDDNDNVLRQATRDEVHVNNFNHRAAHVLLFNDSGHLLLQKRSIWKDRNPGRWDSSAAGHVDAGEDYGQAAAREVGEELGITCPPLERFARLTPSEVTGWEFINVYRGHHHGPVEPDPMEVETSAFFPLEQIRSWATTTPADFSPVFREILFNHL